MSIATVISEGFGSFGNVNFVVTQGFGSYGGAAGATVIFFSGVSNAGGAVHFQGISRPTIQLADAGGGTYTVTKTHELSGKLKPDSVNRETYLIDGLLP